jgi:hypothetical protein
MSGQLLITSSHVVVGPHGRARFTFTDGGSDLRFDDQRTFGHLMYDDGRGGVAVADPPTSRGIRSIRCSIKLRLSRGSRPETQRSSARCWIGRRCLASGTSTQTRCSELPRFTVKRGILADQAEGLGGGSMLPERSWPMHSPKTEPRLTRSTSTWRAAADIFPESALLWTCRASLFTVRRPDRAGTVHEPLKPPLLQLPAKALGERSRPTPAR